MHFRRSLTRSTKIDETSDSSRLHCTLGWFSLHKKFFTSWARIYVFIASIVTKCGYQLQSVAKYQELSNKTNLIIFGYVFDAIYWWRHKIRMNSRHQNSAPTPGGNKILELVPGIVRSPHVSFSYWVVTSLVDDFLHIFEFNSTRHRIVGGIMKIRQFTESLK